MPNKFLPPKTSTVTRTAATPIDGEILYDTDEKKLYYGDGTTVGGKAIGSPTVSDNTFRIQDNSDATKQIAFEVSGITTGTTRTLTVPNASGTIALTSDLSSYAPLTSPTFSTSIVSSGFLEIAQQTAPSTPTTASRLFIDSSNRLSWKGTNGFIRTFDGTSNTADRVYTLPDASGTIALAYTTTATKTGNYTANNLERIPCNTSGGAFTITTPSSGRFQVVDIVGNSPTTGFGASSKALTISAASGTVMGSATLVLNVGGISPEFELIGTDWRIINHG